MARTSGRAALVLAPEQRAALEELAASRTAAARGVDRAKVLLGYSGGTSITELQRRASVVVCIAFAWPAVSQAKCDGKNSAQIAQVLTRGIDLNERFKRSAKSGDEAAYRSLRQQHEQYSEVVAMPCLRKASQMIARGVDQPLLDTAISFSISHENSADETVSEAMASVFARQPAAIASSISRLSPSRARALLRSIEAGWPGVRMSLDSSARQEKDSQLKAVREAQVKRAAVK